MTTEAMPRWRAALNLYLMDDLERAATLAAIQKVSQGSVLISIPTIAASLTALGTKGAALTTNIANVAASSKQYKASLTSRDLSRRSFDLELETLKQLVENQATSGGDVTSMGFALFVASKLSKGPPEPPASLIVRTGKAQGKARVSVAQRGYQGVFVAELSVDPITPTSWTSLPGVGKQRKLSGYASGTRLWVHFASVRNGMQSAWCTPVLVTIP
jgi:hypothetical protein